MTDQLTDSEYKEALDSLTPTQRLAIHEWLRSEVDYTDTLASWAWAAAWIGNPSEL